MATRFVCVDRGRRGRGRTKASWLAAAAAAAFVLAGGAPLAAQEQGVIQGRVVDGRSGAPLSSVQVHIPAIQLGTITAQQGGFSLPNVPPGTHELRAQRLGYGDVTQQVTVSPGEVVVLEFSMQPQVLGLAEVVVTGTAGPQERRAQPALIASLNAADVVERAPVTSVAQVLQSRVPGISLTEGSGTSGAAQHIRIRGAASISLSNEPLIYIDGVRADSRIMTPGVGGQGISRLNDLDPRDIERIEVVKGPAAATLYGADASAGVIQIFTKKGGLGVRSFSQSATIEYNLIDQNWQPPSNFAQCRPQDVVSDSPNPLCRGQAVGTIVEDNPMVRENVFRDGHTTSFAWSGSGGAETFGYHLSLNSTSEDGTLPNNSLSRRGGRFGAEFLPHPAWRMDASFGFTQVGHRLPDNDNNTNGYLASLLGTPLTRGTANDGWFAAFRNSEAIASIRGEMEALRVTPSATLSFNPERWAWMNHRLTFGADFSQTEIRRMFPKNDRGWYAGLNNQGTVNETRSNYARYTMDYLGTVRQTWGADGHWVTHMSGGLQLISTRDDWVNAQGIGLTTNAARAVSAAADRSGGGGFSEQREVGYLLHGQVAHLDRRFVQFGARIDQNSAFGEQADAIILPKVGVSWVVSDEPFWEFSAPRAISTLRARAAYGTTGRSPTPGAAMETYDPAPVAIDPTTVRAGVVPLNPGNFDLRPERGTELEVGLDLGLLEDRIGLEVTFFNKVTDDLLLLRPLAPSLGFTQDAWANIGKVVNRGFEFELSAQLLARRNFSWDARFVGSTLHNELVDMGGVEPFGSRTNWIVEGQQLGVHRTHRILEFDLQNERAIVSDTLEAVANLHPRFEGSFTSGVTVGQQLRFDAQLDSKAGYSVFSRTDDFRERQLATGERWIKRDQLPLEERLRRFGPFVTRDGTVIDRNEASEAYIMSGNFVRLRELSVTYSLSDEMAARIRVNRAQVTLAGRNLGLWTSYEGAGKDPEMIGDVAVTGRQFSRLDWLTVPPGRRFVSRFSVSF
jgi:TonB-dependent starch-binding outer membrane protein SusC